MPNHNLPWSVYALMQYNQPPWPSPLSLAGAGERIGGWPSPLSLASRPLQPPAAPAPSPSPALVGGLGGAMPNPGLLGKVGGAAMSMLGSPATALIPMAFQTGLGLFQLVTSILRRRPERPVYRIPEGIKASAAEAQHLAQGVSPVARLALQQTQQTFGDTNAMLRRNVGSAANLAALIGATAATTGRQVQALKMAEEAQRMQRQQVLDTNRRVLAQYKDKRFQLNQMQPYQDAARTKAALTQAGLLNINSGLSALGGSAQNIQAMMMMGVNPFLAGSMGNTMLPYLMQHGGYFGFKTGG